MEHESPETLRERAHRLYDEGIIGFRRRRAMLDTADAREATDSTMTRDPERAGLVMSETGQNEVENVEHHTERREVA